MLDIGTTDMYCDKCNKKLVVHRILTPGGEKFYIDCPERCNEIRYGNSPDDAWAEYYRRFHG